MSDLAEFARIESALAFIPAIDRELWVEVGMAVKSELGESGREAWDSWSRQAESYKPESAKAVWRSIKPDGGVTIATLFHHAIQHGWRDDGTRQQLSSQQIAARRAAAIERSSAADADKARAQAEAAQRAATLIQSCTTGQHHPYLASKGLPEALALIDEDGAMVVPMRDCLSNKITSAQIIRLIENEWVKKNFPDGRAKGAMLRIGPARAGELWFVEGYATGLSLSEALRLMRLSAAVIVCFSDRNLVHVADQMPGRRYVFADNDDSRAGERAAWDTGLPYAMSPEIGDANDLHQSRGVMAVAKLVMEARKR
jgi:putative DNA primase/helicase